MKKSIMCLVLAMGLIVTVAGCKRVDGTGEDEWGYETVVKSGSNTSAESGEPGSEDSEAGSETVQTPSGGAQNSQPTGDVSAQTGSHGTLVVEGAGKDPNADYSVSGTVTVSVDTARVNDYQALFDSLKAVYPKVTLKLDYFAHTTADSAAEYLSTRAAAGNMPDVVYDDAGPLPTYLAQGWMRSLDEFAANDPDYRSYVASNLKADYTYGGKLYALPHQAHFETFLLNTDVLNALNLSMPSLSWTIGDFESYCKKATTNKYSAQEDFGSLYNSFAHNYSPATTLYGYNPASKQFDVSGLIQSTKLLLTLRSIPGLEANVLRKTSSGGVTDYTKKFGTGSYSDNFVAFHKGLTLFHGLGTWEYAIKRKTVTNFNWTMWPFPQETQGVMPYHVDHCFMTSSAKNTAAAWQVLRYLTYSYEGNIARLSMYDAANAGKYALQNNYYFPTCTHPAVAAKFKSLPKVDDTAKYLYENMGKCYRYDMVKLVPDWNNIVTSYYTQAMNTAISGTASLVDQTLTEAAAKANTVITNSWNTFNGKLATAQK